MSNSLPSIDEINDQAMMEYLHHFLQIGEFKKIQNGKELLVMIRENPDHPKVKSAIRKILGLFHTDSPGAKVCSLQFLKQAMETNCWSVIELVQRSLLPKVVQVTEYRPHIRSIQRGSSYFINNFDKNVTDEQVSNLIKLSSTFFRMIHECVYVWGAHYFPGTSFDRMRIKLMKKFDFPKYPEQFKFFTDKKIENFKLNCKDMIRKMMEYNDQVMSKSSVEKKRDTSVKPSRVSSSINNKNTRSQSTEQLSNLPPKKSTKQKEEQFNSKKKISKQQSPKKQQVQKQNEQIQRKQSDSLTNSSLLRKKNSFKQVSVDKVIEAESKHSPRRQQANKRNNQSRTNVDQGSNKQARFKTISQQSDSEGGRYSVKESIQQTSQQFSQVDYLYENRANQSPRSQIELKKQKNDTKLPLKKYISEEIIAEVPVKKIISLNQVKRDDKKQQRKNQSVKVDQKYQQTKSKKEKQSQKIVRQQMKVDSKERQQRNMVDAANNSHDKKKEDKTPLKSVPKLPLPKENRVNQQRKKRKDLSAHKKFVSSEEQNSHKEIEGNTNEILQNSQINQQKTLQNIKMSTDNSRKMEKQRMSKQKNIVSKESPQQAQPKLPAKDNEVVNQKPVRMAKPQKIKGTSSGKTIFEGKEYSVVQTITQVKSVPKQEQTKVVLNAKQGKAKEQVREKPKLSSDKNIYQMVQDIEDTEIMTIELKKEDSSSQINKNSAIIQTNKPNSRQKQTLGIHNTTKQQTVISRQEPISNKQETVKFFKPDKEQNKMRNTKIIQEIPSHSQKQEGQAKTDKHVPNLDPIRIYSPKRKDENLQFESPIYSYRKQNHQISLKEGRQNSLRSRLKKNQEVCMVIHPQDESFSQMHVMSRKESIEEVKNILKDQIAEQFAQLRNTFISQQQENIQQSVESYASKLKSQMISKNKNGDKSAVDCGIQAKIRDKHKKRVASTRRYKMFDEAQEDEAKNNLKDAQTTNNTIQNNVLAINKVTELNQTMNNEKSLKGKQTRASSKNKASLKPGQYEPNTLLYALYRQRSMNK